MANEAKLDSSWLTDEAKRNLNSAWQERVLLVLKDMSNWPQLRYALAVGLDGSKLTGVIGPDGKEAQVKTYPPLLLFYMAGTVEEYLADIDHSAPAHVTIELEDEVLFIGSTGEFYLVASLDADVHRGYMSMKLSKRIKHLRSLFSREQMGAVFK